MNRVELKELIREELHAILHERSLAEAEFTSAGSVPRKHGRKMSPAQISKRDTLGRKILAALDKGKNTSNPLRKAFKKWASKNDHPIGAEKTMKSYAWAMASDWAIKGKDFPPVHESVTEEYHKHGKLQRLARKVVPGYGKYAAGERAKDYAFSAKLDRDASKFPQVHGKDAAAQMGRDAKRGARGSDLYKKISAGKGADDPRKTIKVKNPKTGEEILALSAYHAGPTHPAYAIAKAALKRKK